MSDFAASLRRPPAPMAGPASPMPAGAAGGASELAMQLQAVNQLLLQALQSGDIPPDALMALQDLAEIFMQLGQGGGGGPAPGPAPAPPGVPA